MSHRLKDVVCLLMWYDITGGTQKDKKNEIYQLNLW